MAHQVLSRDAHTTVIKMEPPDWSSPPVAMEMVAMAHSSASSLSTCHQAPVQTGVAHQGTPDDFKPSSVAMEIKPLMEIDLTAQETAVSSPQPNTSHYSTPVMLHTPQASNTPTPPHPHSTPVATHVHTSSSAKKAVHRKATSQQQWEPEINRAPPSSEKDRAPPSSEKMPRRQLRKVIKRCLDKYPNSPNTVLRRQLQEKVSLNHIVDMFRRGENSDLLGPLLQRGVISLTIPGHEAPPPSEPSTPQSSEEREGSVNPAGVSGGGGDYTPTQPPTHTTQRPPILPTPQSPSPTAPQPPTHTTTGHTPCIQGTSFEGSAESVIRKHLYTVSDQNTPGDADSANPVDRTDVLQNVTPVDAESAVVTGTLHGDDDGLPLFSDIDLSKYQASRGTGITSNSMLPTLHTSTPAQHHVSTHSVASSTPPQGHAHTPHGVAPDNTESDEEFLYNTRLQESSQPPITLHSPGTQPPTTLHSPGTQPPTTLHSPGTQPPTTLHSPGSTSFCTDEQLNTDGPSSLPDDMPHPLDDRPHPLVEQMGDCCEESDQELLALYRNSFAILKTVTGWAQPGAESAETSQDSEENPVSEGDFEESDESAESSPASEGNARDSEENAESANTGLDTKENAESAETRSDIEDNAESADTGLDIEENAESAETGLDIEENAESAETGLDIKENAESAEIGLDVEENAESASGYDEYVHSSDELSVGGANSPYPPLAVSGPTSKRSEEELISQRLRSRVQPAAERRDLHHSADSSGMASTDEEPMAMGSGQSEDTDPGPSEQSEEPVSQRLRSRRPQLTQPAYSSGTVSSDDLSVVKGGRLREQSGSDEEPVAQRRGRRTPVRIVVDTSSDEQSNRSNRSDKVRRVSQRLRRSPPSPDSSPGGRHSDRKPVRKRHKTHHRPSNQNDEPIALRLRRRRASPRVNEISDATVTLSDESTSDGQLTVSDDNKESSNENEAPISQRLRKRWPRQQHLHTQLQSSTRPVTRLVTRLVTKAFVDSDSSDDEHLAGREIPQTAGESNTPRITDVCDKELLSDSDVDVGGLSQFVHGETPIIIISDSDQSSNEAVCSSVEAGGCVLVGSSSHLTSQVTDCDATLKEEELSSSPLSHDQQLPSHDQYPKQSFNEPSPLKPVRSQRVLRLSRRREGGDGKMGDLTNVAREVHNKVSELNNKTGEITFGSQVFTQPAHQKPPVTQSPPTGGSHDPWVSYDAPRRLRANDSTARGEILKIAHAYITMIFTETK